MTTSNVRRDLERDDCNQASTLEDCVRAVVHQAVQCHMHREDVYLVFDNTEPLKDCLRALCSHAQGRGLRVERLIVSLKESAESMPAAQSIIRSAGGERVVSQLVALLIDEFYAMSEPKN